ELSSLTTLTWDPGTSDTGTQVFTNQSNTGGDYYFAITTLSTLNGAWRSALAVTGGEADLYLQYGSVPSTTYYNVSSHRVGSDGFVLSQAAGQFAASQTWYFMVHATPGAQWTLLTGEAYVQQLPPLTADASSGATNNIGPEGTRFYKTTISSGTLAWKLWLNGLTNQVLVKQSGTPFPNGYNDWSGTNGQLLLVPSYVVIGSQYFVAVSGTPGVTVQLDSRQQPITDIPFGTNLNLSITGYGYQTFRVQVPVQQIAWQMTVTPSLGDGNIAVRHGSVPNEYVNDAFSEQPGTVGDSVTLVPPMLTDGTFYITVYGTTPYSCAFTNGQP